MRHLTMKLKISIDEKLLANARAVTGITSNAEVIEKALQNLVFSCSSEQQTERRIAAQKGLLALHGKIGFFDKYH